MNKRPPAVPGQRISARTEYRTGYPDQARMLCLLGATAEDLAIWFGVGTTTIDRWMNEHRDFYWAVKDGRRLADARVAQALYNRAIGYEAKEKRIEVGTEGLKQVDITKHIAPDVAAARFWLTNRQPELWREKKEVELTDNRDLATRILEARRRTKGLTPDAGMGNEERVSGDVLDALMYSDRSAPIRLAETRCRRDRAQSSVLMTAERNLACHLFRGNSAAILAG